MGQTKSKVADPIVISGSNPLNQNSASLKNNESQFSSEVDLVKKKIQTSMDDKMRAVDDFDGLISRLQNKDPSLTEVILCNSNVISQKESNFSSLVEALRNNTRIVTVELVNVNMRDNECAVLMMSLKTCTELVKLNVESNSLSSVGIEMVACMAEKHPSLQELRLANQRLTVGIEAERALANCLSQNTNIIKLSHRFIEKFVQVYVDKYIQRNIDLKRVKRVASSRDVRQITATKQPSAGITGNGSSPLTTATSTTNNTSALSSITVAYPFPKRDLLEQVAASLHSEELLKSQNEAEAAAHWESFQKSLNNENNNDSNHSKNNNSNNSSNNNALNNNNTMANNNVKSSTPKSFFSFGSKSINNSTTTTIGISNANSTSNSSPRVATSGGRGIQSNEQLIDGNITNTNMEDLIVLTSSGYRQTKNAFETLISRLQKNDMTLTEINLNHSKLLSAQKEKNFLLFNESLKNSRCNKVIVNIELVHIEMKDKDFLLLMDGLLACTALEKINLESNYLSSLGIELIAEMAEKHSSLQEIRVSNQRMAVGIEAERALANCLSQNTNIVKLSHTFTEKYVIVLVDKYIQRNIEIQRRLRVSTRNKKAYIQSKQQAFITEPYPFPKRDIFAIMSLHSSLVASSAGNSNNNHNTTINTSNMTTINANSESAVASVKDLVINMSTPHAYVAPSSTTNGATKELPKKLRQSKLNSMNIIKPQAMGVYKKGELPLSSSSSSSSSSSLKAIMNSSNESNGTSSTDDLGDSTKTTDTSSDTLNDNNAATTTAAAGGGAVGSSVDREYLVQSHGSVYSGISSDNDYDDTNDHDNHLLSSPLSSTDDYDVDNSIPIITINTDLSSSSIKVDSHEDMNITTPTTAIGEPDSTSVMMTMDEAKLRESLLSLNDSHHELMKAMHNSKLGSTFVTSRASQSLSNKSGGSNGFSARSNHTYLLSTSSQ